MAEKAQAFCSIKLEIDYFCYALKIDHEKITNG
jgi:hypothetical protein